MGSRYSLEHDHIYSNFVFKSNNSSYKLFWKTVLFSLMTFLSVTHVIAADAKHILLTADEWCPYNCEPDSELPGYAVEIARSIFEHEGYTFEYQVFPWTRAINQAAQGNSSGVIGASKQETPNFYFPNIPVGVARQTLYSKPGLDWKYENYQSLESVRLGAIQGYAYGTLEQDYIKKHRESERLSILRGNNALERLIKMLNSNRIDVFVEDENVLNYELQKSISDSDLIRKGSIADESVYIAFSPVREDSAKLAKILDDGLQRMKRSGEIAEILQKYQVKIWF